MTWLWACWVWLTWGALVDVPPLELTTCRDCRGAYGKGRDAEHRCFELRAVPGWDDDGDQAFMNDRTDRQQLLVFLAFVCLSLVVIGVAWLWRA